MADERPVDPAAVNAAVVAELRAELGVRRVKAPELAERTGIPAYALRRLFREERPPVFGEVLAIAAALELDISDVTERALDRARAEGRGIEDRRKEALRVADTFL
jgi:transcriptional regulator with XRE-family HTH domain